MNLLEWGYRYVIKKIYPLRQLIEDLDDLVRGRKKSRNISRIIIGLGSAILAGFIPYDWWPAFGEHIQPFIEGAINLFLGERASGNYTLVQDMTVLTTALTAYSLSIVVIKKLWQGYNHAYHGVSNSNYIIDNETINKCTDLAFDLYLKAHPSDRLTEEVADKKREELKEQLSTAFAWVIERIKDAKLDEEKYVRHRIRPQMRQKQQFSKDEYKLVIWELFQGNLESYNILLRGELATTEARIETNVQRLHTMLPKAGDIALELAPMTAHEPNEAKTHKERTLTVRAPATNTLQHLQELIKADQDRLERMQQQNRLIKSSSSSIEPSLHEPHPSLSMEESKAITPHYNSAAANALQFMRAINTQEDCKLQHLKTTPPQGL